MKTHPFDALSFVSGLLITVIGLTFLIPADPGDLFGYIGDVGEWFWPVVLIGIGVAMLAPLASRRNREEPEESEEA